MSSIAGIEKEVPAVRKDLPVCVLDDDRGMLELLLTFVEGMGFPVMATTRPLTIFPSSPSTS